jgi:hypothetical protein
VREERGSWCAHDLYIVDASQLVIAGDVRGPALAYNSGACLIGQLVDRDV